MKRTTTKKKLAVDAETVRTLETKELGRAVGGYTGLMCSRLTPDCSWQVLTCHSNGPV